VKSKYYEVKACSPKGIGGPFPGDKSAGREADDSLPSLADVKDDSDIIPLPHTFSLRGT
jgi:hypothetical protein